jgi:hypothetical protein
LIETLNVFQPTFVEYLYKSSSLNPCDNFGWICLGYTGNTSYLDAINLNEGESIWILVNAESALGAGQLFQVRCAHPFACDAMEQSLVVLLSLIYQQVAMAIHHSTTDWEHHVTVPVGKVVLKKYINLLHRNPEHLHSQ